MNKNKSNNTLLEVNNLKKHYPIKRGLFYRTVGWVNAVDGVSFSIKKAKTLGLVGESGCGKTTLAKAVLRLIKPDQGSVYYGGEDLTKLSANRLRSLRKDLQIIFQNPFNSLDPRFTIEKVVQEGISNFASKDEKKEIPDLTIKTLKAVGLSSDSLYRYPHEFSGGQRQRISIARSLILNPKLLVLDEPVSSLDVSIQAQIINLLLELQEKLGLTYLFIAHDLDVVKCMSDEICVMYLGKVVEQTFTKELFKNPLHPYTKMLLSSSPKLEVGKDKTKIEAQEKEISALGAKGCKFCPRCKFKMDICKDKEPDLKEASPGHFVSCHLF